MPEVLRAKMPSVAKPIVANRGIGDEFLEVALAQRGETAVENADHGQPENIGGEDMVP